MSGIGIARLSIWDRVFPKDLPEAAALKHRRELRGLRADLPGRKWRGRTDACSLTHYCVSACKLMVPKKEARDVGKNSVVSGRSRLSQRSVVVTTYIRGGYSR